MKKQKGRKMAYGGYTGDPGTNRGSWSGDGRSLGVTTGTTTGTSATNRPSASAGTRSQNPMAPPAIRKKSAPVGMAPTYRPDPSDFASLNLRGDPLDATGVPGGHGIVGYKAGGLAKRGIGRALMRGKKKK